MLVDFLILGLVVGWLRGGRLENLSQIRFPFLWLVFLGMGAKFLFLFLPSSFAPLFHFVSMGVVLVGTLFNWRLRGIPFMALGSLCNIMVMGVNEGKMPVSIPVAQWLKLDSLVHHLQQGAYPEYVIMSVSSRFSFLADVLPYFSLLLRRFFVVSVGDYFLGLGVMWFLVHYMGRKERKACGVESPKQLFP
ncbi:MAG: DUF5317 family protein [Candidatus Caldatribacteriaceae bacterium]